MSDKQLIKGIQAEESWAFETLYRDNFKALKSYVIRNSGTLEDAKDVFQDTIIALIKMVSRPHFEIRDNTKVSTLFYAIGSRLWLLNLRNRRIKTTNSDISEMNYEFSADEESMIEKRDYEEKHQLIAKSVKLLGEDCQKLLELYYFKNQKLKDIAGMLSYTEAFVRVKKNRCMNALKEKVKASHQ